MKYSTFLKASMALAPVTLVWMMVAFFGLCAMDGYIFHTLSHSTFQEIPVWVCLLIGMVMVTIQIVFVEFLWINKLPLLGWVIAFYLPPAVAKLLGYAPHLEWSSTFGVLVTNVILYGIYLWFATGSTRKRKGMRLKIDGKYIKGKIVHVTNLVNEHVVFYVNCLGKVDYISSSYTESMLPIDLNMYTVVSHYTSGRYKSCRHVEYRPWDMSELIAIA